MADTETRVAEDGLTEKALHRLADGRRRQPDAAKSLGIGSVGRACDKNVAGGRAPVGISGKHMQQILDDRDQGAAFGNGR